MKKNLNSLIDLSIKYSSELSAVLLLICLYQIKFISPANPIIFSDGFGYYAYLPAIFIYNDLAFEFCNYYTQTYYPDSVLYDFTFDVGVGTVNRYFSGPAILWLPFFLIADLLAMVGPWERDGYSNIYQLSVAIAAITYVYLGIKCTKSVIINLGLSSKLAALTTTLVLFGTNLFYYTINESSMSHAYSFSLIAIFLYLTRYFLKDQKKVLTVFLLGLILGLIAITRPINTIVILLIPFILENKKDSFNFFSNILSSVKYISFGLFGIFIPVLIQCTMWYLQTGHWIVYSYGEWGFNWTDPQFANVLFSFRKGLFIYTPLLLLVMPGVIYYLRRNIFSTVFLIIFVVLFTYIISSWEVWEYGMSFGMRPMVDVYSVAAIMLAGTFAFAGNKWLKIPLLVIAVSLLCINQIQDYQYRNYILHWYEMNYASYKKVFLKTGSEYRNILWHRGEEPSVLESLEFTYDFENPKLYWDYFAFAKYCRHAPSGNMVTRANKEEQFSITFRKPMYNFPSLDSLGVRFQAKIYLTDINVDAHLVVEVTSEVNPYQYESLRIFDIQDRVANEWLEVEFETPLLPKMYPEDHFKFYLWNISGEEILMDDVRLEFFSNKK
ncbi:MAG: hypothetical protein HKN22_04610 [Bacteroidia bacterium]|nr:hypothetical protein [Bacteroidia bacterium]